MGVEYEHYLIPEDNTYKPSPEELIRLIDALLDGGFVSRTARYDFPRVRSYSDAASDGEEDVRCYARLGDRRYALFPCPCSSEDIAALGQRDFVLVWPVDSTNESGLKYPLSPFPEWGDAYYELRLHVARDFVYHLSERIEPFDEVTCQCGQQLDFDEQDEDLGKLPVFYDGRIHRICPACAKPFRPQKLIARVRDGRTGEVSERAGGCTYLFAVVIDCGKGFAREGWPIRATGEFLDTVTHVLGHEFYEIGDFY